MLLQLFRDKILLIGAGGHARSCIEVIERENKYKILGLIGREEEIGSFQLGYRVIGSDNDLSQLRKIVSNALVCVGQISSSSIRKVIYSNLLDLKFNMPAIYSPNANISKHAKVGKGTIVMQNVTINSNVTVGENCILNSNALLEHDVIIGDHCHVSTGSIVNGGTSIGSETFIGSGAVIRDNIFVPDNTFIPMGSIVKN